MTKRTKLDVAIDQVATFITSVAQVEPLSETVDAELRFGRGEQLVQLDRVQTHTFRTCRDALQAALSNPEQVSDEAVDELLQRAMLDALEPMEDGTALTEQMPPALDRLKQALLTPPSTWDVYFRVVGLETAGATVRFGRIEFSTHEPAPWDPFLVGDTRFVGELTARVLVAAVDVAAARTLALRHLRSTADILNFYTDILFPAGHTRVVLPGEYEASHTRTLIVPAGTVAESHAGQEFLRYAGIMQPMSLLRLLRTPNTNWGAAYVSDLLSKDSRSSLEERLLAALQWAGRATVDPRPEEAFLLYAIALESLLVASRDTELTYRLRIRAAHLLGTTVEERRQVSDEVGKLYGLRSKIVHTGSFAVSPLDLGTLRYIAKQVMLRMLTDPLLRALPNHAALEAWFDEQVLR